MKRNLPKYKITIDDEYSEGENLGIEQIAFTKNPAILVKGLAFASDAKKVSFNDDLKYRICAPAMIPMEIYRNDDSEYYVEFTAEEIDAIHKKFMGSLTNKNVFNLEHDNTETVPAYLLEAWIVDSPETDKAYMSYGIEVPKGTLMVTTQVTDKEYYKQLVANNQVGYSIEGFLGMKLSEIIQGKYSENTYTDYPEAAIENAKIALRWADENGWGDCGTPVGKARANQLANKEGISEETIARMAAFERHRQNSQKELGDGCGRLMWLSWGGDEGIEWASRKLEQINNNKNQKLEKMNEKTLLPAGEYTDKDGNVFVVAEDGTITPKTEMTNTSKEEEIAIDTTEVPVGDEAPVETVSGETETKETEIKETELADAEVEVDADTVVEDTELAEAPTEEVVVDAPVETYSKEEVDAKFEELYKLIADMQAEDDAEDVIEGMVPAEVKMNVHDRFAAFVNFSKQ